MSQQKQEKQENPENSEFIIQPDKYYVRNDGKIAGPFIISESKNLWDITNEELYSPDGKCLSSSSSDEVIMCEDKKYRKVIVNLEKGKRYLNRRGEITNRLSYIDGVDVTDFSKPVQYIDKKSGKIYDTNGWLSESKKKSDEDLLLVVDNDMLNLVYFLKRMKDNAQHHKDNHENEDDLCPCEKCISFRERFNEGTEFKLLKEIERLRTECLNYLVDLPELPNFYYLSVVVHVEMYQFYCDLLMLFDEDFNGIKNLPKLLKEYGDLKEGPIPLAKHDIDMDTIMESVRTSEDFDGEEHDDDADSEEYDIRDENEEEKTNKKSKEPEKHYRSFETKKAPVINEHLALDYRNFLYIQIRFLIEKNYIVDFPVKKFKKLPREHAQQIILFMNKIFDELKETSEVRTIKFAPIIGNLDYATIKKNSYSEEDFDKDGILILNPEMIYSAMIRGGKIVSLLPIAKRKNK